MKNKYFLLSTLFIALFCSFLFTNNCHALNSYSGQIKLIKHFKTGNKCGVGTDCLYDDGSGEMQSFASTVKLSKLQKSDQIKRTSHATNTAIRAVTIIQVVLPTIAKPENYFWPPKPALSFLMT